MSSGVPEQVLQARSLPLTVGRYQLISELGSGGMATVYLAHLEGRGQFRRQVAVKLLHAHQVADPRVVRQFLTEARIAARIRHPNVVPVTDLGESSEGPFVVMDYVEGESLHRLMKWAAARGERVPDSVALRILSDLLRGLDGAHSLRDDDDRLLGVVHRDVSPHNILVGVDGVARLIDFGVVKVLTEGDHTRAGIVKGKLRYMAPEQARGRKLQASCDVWATGVVAWELFAGRGLFVGDDDVDTLMSITMRDALGLGEARADVPAEVDRVINKALNRDPSQRYAHAEELRVELLHGWQPQVVPADMGEVARWVQGMVAVGSEVRRRAPVVDRTSASEREAQATSTNTREDGEISQPEPTRLIGTDGVTEALPLAAGSGESGAFVTGSAATAARTDVPGSGLRRKAYWSALGTGFVLLALFTAEYLGGELAHARFKPTYPSSSIAVAVATRGPEKKVVVTANVPIRELRVNGRLHALPTASQEISLDGVEAGSRPLEIEAVSSTGVRLRLRVALDADGVVALRFEPSTRRPFSMPKRARPAALSTASEEVPLAPFPSMSER